jgi:hypothetical protein
MDLQRRLDTNRVEVELLLDVFGLRNRFLFHTPARIAGGVGQMVGM